MKIRSLFKKELIVKLSKQLKQDNDCGDFGEALEGYSERAKKLEEYAWEAWHKEALDWGASVEKAFEYADKKLNAT